MATTPAPAAQRAPTLSRGELAVPLVVAAPAVLAACLIVVLEINRFMEQRSRPAVDASSFAEVLRSGDYEQAFEIIRAGQDPNTPILFRDSDLTGNRDIMVTPLLIAVATRVDNTVRMLMSAGVRIDAPGNRFALCLADQLGDKTIAGVITHDGGPAAKTVTCPAAPPSREAALLAFVE